MNVNDGNRFKGLSERTPQSPSRMPNDHDDTFHTENPPSFGIVELDEHDIVIGFNESSQAAW